MLWHKPVIPTRGKLRQEDCSQSKANRTKSKHTLLNMSFREPASDDGCGSISLAEWGGSYAENCPENL